MIQRADPVIRLFRRSDRLATTALRTLRGAFDGIWLTVLSRERLARIDENYYDNAEQYTAEAYNRGGLSGWEQAAVEQHFGGVRRIVVTSAGGGREVLALAKAGYDVAGYEPHEALARFGATLLAGDGVDATVSRCERDVWPSAAGQADGVVVGWGGYMLIVGRALRVSFLRDAARSLPVGAPLLVSFFFVERQDARLRTAAWIAGPLRRLLRREPVTVGDALMPMLVHYFTREDIEAELTDGGFEMVDFGFEEYGWAVGRVRRPAEERRD